MMSPDIPYLATDPAVRANHLRDQHNRHEIAKKIEAEEAPPKRRDSK
jgi:hypothetical protein